MSSRRLRVMIAQGLVTLLCIASALPAGFTQAHGAAPAADSGGPFLRG